MAKIIEFHSKAYNNLSLLFAICESKEALEEYFECMAVLNETGRFLPGEAQALSEQVRAKRLELARPEQKPAAIVDHPGLYLYHPEMGEQKPQCQIEAARSYYGRHFHIYTPLQLKGRGIVFENVCDEKNTAKSAYYKIGWNEYTVTVRAFDKLCEQYSVSQECLLD